MGFWPLPTELDCGSNVVWLSPEVQLLATTSTSENVTAKWYHGLGGDQLCASVSSNRPPIADPNRNCKHPHPKTASTPKDIVQPTDVVQVAFERIKRKIFSENFVPYKLHPPRTKFEPDLSEYSDVQIKEVVLMEDFGAPESMSREAYALTIRSDGHVHITIASPVGAIRAFDTFAQAFYAHTALGTRVYTPYSPLKVKDAPYFEHRGLNLDITRNWISPQDVSRTIEAVSFNKMNKLHLHASDSQSWPLEIPALPDLANKGAYRQDQVWCVKDLEAVQRHGLYHGVEVYLEIDMPGHTGSIFHSHPDLITAYNQTPWSKYAQEPPSGQLRLNSPEVFTFLETLFADLVPRVSPFNTHFHVGGDELNLECYALDPTMKSSSRDFITPYLQKFFDHVTSLVLAQDLTPILWQDMLLEWDLQFPPSTIFQAWRPGALSKIVEKGHRALFGECEEWYLDSGFGTFIDPDPSNPDRPIKHPYADWCAPYKNWRRILSYDPLAKISQEQKHLVVGGEVHLWGELTDSVNLEFMLWPRTSAAAEMLWRGKGEVCEGTTRRLAEMRERLVQRGVGAGVVQMEWGLRNQGQCIL